MSASAAVPARAGILLLLLGAVALSAAVRDPVRRLSVTAPHDRTLVLIGGSYLDVRAGLVHPNGAIVIRGGRIAAIRPPGQRWTTPAGAKVIRLDGRTILPGLIDANVHLTL